MEGSWSYGWRAWIGRIEPSYRWVEGPIWEKILPEGVDLIVSCVGVERLSDEHLEKAYDNITEHVKRFANESFIDVINVGGSPVVGFKGYKGYLKLEDDLAKLTNKPIVTSLGATIAALKASGIKKLVMVAPYVDKRTNERIEVLHDAGFEVLASKGLGLEKNTEFCTLNSSTGYRMAKEIALNNPNADGVFMACSGWPTVAHLKHLEDDLDKPVISSLQAQIWACLKQANVKESITGFGTLFEK